MIWYIYVAKIDLVYIANKDLVYTGNIDLVYRANINLIYIANIDLQYACIIFLLLITGAALFTLYPCISAFLYSHVVLLIGI